MSNFFNLESTWLGGISGTANSSVPVVDLSYNTIPLGNALSDSSFNLALQNQIINNEQQRLNTKQQSIDLAKTSQNRMLVLNNSYSARYNATTKIVLVIVVVFIIFIGLMFLQKAVPAIPSGIMDLAYIVDLSIGAIICLMIYMNIQTRDPVYFDQISIPSPVIPDSSGAIQSTSTSMNTGFGITCIGQMCCSTGTTWDSTSNTCLAPSTATPTTSTATPTTTTSAFTTIADSANEYDQYAPY